MSEQHTITPETHLTKPEIDNEVRENLQNLFEKAEHSTHEHQERLPEIQQSIEETAISGQETQARASEQEDTQNQPLFVNRELKNIAYDRNLARIRKQLPTADKLLSKVAHHPVVSKVSEFSEATVARPSGLLGGGVLGLLGSSVLLYMAKHYGFEYNYLAFFVLFVTGFLAGILTELFFKLARR